MRTAQNLAVSPVSTSQPITGSRPGHPQPCNAQAAKKQPHRLASYSNGHSNGLSDGPQSAVQSSRVEKADYAKFVHFFRSAGPYIEGFRGCTFVVVVPGEVCPVLVALCMAACSPDLSLPTGPAPEALAARLPAGCVPAPRCVLWACC